MVLQHLPGDQRDLDDLPPGDAGHRVEVDPQLVGVVEVLGAHRVRVEVDAAEVDHPGERRGVADDDLVGERAGGVACSSATSIQSGRFAGARFWKNASSSMPLTNRLRIIGRPATPRSAPSATAR